MHSGPSINTRAFTNGTGFNAFSSACHISTDSTQPILRVAAPLPWCTGSSISSMSTMRIRPLATVRGNKDFMKSREPGWLLQPMVTAARLEKFGCWRWLSRAVKSARYASSVSSKTLGGVVNEMLRSRRLLQETCFTRARVLRSRVAYEHLENVNTSRPVLEDRLMSSSEVCVAEA